MLIPLPTEHHHIDCTSPICATNTQSKNCVVIPICATNTQSKNCVTTFFPLSISTHCQSQTKFAIVSPMIQLSTQSKCGRQWFQPLLYHRGNCSVRVQLTSNGEGRADICLVTYGCGCFSLHEEITVMEAKANAQQIGALKKLINSTCIKFPSNSVASCTPLYL